VQTIGQSFHLNWQISKCKIRLVPDPHLQRAPLMKPDYFKTRFRKNALENGTSKFKIWNPTFVPIKQTMPLAMRKPFGALKERVHTSVLLELHLHPTRCCCYWDKLEFWDRIIIPNFGALAEHEPQDHIAEARNSGCTLASAEARHQE